MVGGEAPDVHRIPSLVGAEHVVWESVGFSSCFGEFYLFMSIGGEETIEPSALGAGSTHSGRPSWDRYQC